MKNKFSAGKALARTIMAAVVLTALLSLLPCGTARAADTEYIVKFKASYAWLMEDGAPFKVVSEAEMERLRAQDLLEWYEPDGDAVLMDGMFDENAHWNLGMIGAQTSFERGCLGQGIRVGVLDSGVNPHPDLEGRLLAGHNYISGAANPDDTADTYGHGTRVAGLVAAVSETGYVGVAPGAQIVPLKVTDGKTVKVSALSRAIYGGVDDYGCRVLNLSLGILTEYESVKEAVEYAEAQGVVVVSAVGNGGTEAIYYPAAYDSVIGVGAVDRSGMLYSRSNRSRSVWLTAPGVDVLSTANQGGYALSTGTSFSVPQVAGAAAVLLGADPALRPAALRTLLAETASDRGAAGYDTSYGYGILDLGLALNALGVGEEQSPLCFTAADTEPADDLQNLTDEAVDCTYALAYYDGNGICQSVQTWTLTVPARGSTAVQPPDEDRRWAQFAFETDAGIPLAPSRSGGHSEMTVAPSENTEAGFYQVGSAPDVTVELRSAAGRVTAVSRNVDGRYGNETFYPGADRLEVALSDVQPGAAYLLTVSDPETGKVYYAGQQIGTRRAVFHVAFTLPEARTDLTVTIGSTAERFAARTFPLSYIPAADGTICPGGDACPMVRFADLDPAAWYHDGVHWALDMGVMNGVAERIFRPDVSVSRSMLVTMLWRIEGEPEASGDMTFGDVAPDIWYTEAIRWAAGAGIVNGYNAGTFGPDDPISREQLAVILWRYAGCKGTDADRLGRYLDTEKISPWALDAMRWAVQTGLIEGVGEDTLCPKGVATRAQAATLLMRLDAVLSQ